MTANQTTSIPVTKWLVELRGPQEELQDLERELPNPPFRVFNHDGRVFLEAAALQTCQTGRDVDWKARDLIAPLNGVGKLKNPAWSGVEANGIWMLDSNGQMARDAIYLRGDSGGIVSAEAFGGSTPTFADAVQAMLQHPHIASALSIFEAGDTAWHLRKTMEELRDHFAPGNRKPIQAFLQTQSWYDQSTADWFHKSINVGHSDSVHPTEPVDWNARFGKTGPMSIPEARQFVARTLEAVIQREVPSAHGGRVTLGPPKVTQAP